MQANKQARIGNDVNSMGASSVNFSVDYALIPTLDYFKISMDSNHKMATQGYIPMISNQNVLLGTG